MTTNIFDVVVGKGVLKWDAVWRVIVWLADPAEGHGLGDNFQSRLVTFCLGRAQSPVDLAVEFYLGRDSEGKTKHPDIAVGYPDLLAPKSVALIDDLGSVSPNNMRKINNLMSYAELCSTKWPNAERQIVVVTDTLDFSRFTKLRERFSSTSLLFLPLQTIGSWLIEMKPYQSPVVRDFAEWAGSL